ncbi:42229_t:CDS:2, partial [Gigaspora margarita]
MPDLAIIENPHNDQMILTNNEAMLSTENRIKGDQELETAGPKTNKHGMNNKTDMDMEEFTIEGAPKTTTEVLARKCELKEKLYSALRSKAEINNLSEKLFTKYLEQEKELQQSQKALSVLFSHFIRKNVCLACDQTSLDYNVKEFEKKIVDKPRPYSRVKLCEEADGIYYFKPAPAFS